MRKIVPICLPLWLAACGPAVTYSNKVPSTDGRWSAIIESRQWSGPGNNFDATQVQLQQAEQPAFQILNFTHEYGGMKLQLAWLDAHHLLVRYAPSDRPCDHVDLTFQAVQAGGIEITTSPLPGSANTVRC